MFRLPAMGLCVDKAGAVVVVLVCIVLCKGRCLLAMAAAVVVCYLSFVVDRTVGAFLSFITPFILVSRRTFDVHSSGIFLSRGVSCLVLSLCLAGQQVIACSNRYPLVSGFYKLLNTAMFLCDRLRYFKPSVKTMEDDDTSGAVTKSPQDTNASYCMTLVRKFAHEVRRTGFAPPVVLQVCCEHCFCCFFSRCKASG